jgi:hypothetical protein
VGHKWEPMAQCSGNDPRILRGNRFPRSLLLCTECSSDTAKFHIDEDEVGS